MLTNRHAFMFFTPNSDPTSECRRRNQDSSDQATFLQSSIVQFWWSCVNCILRVLLLSDRSGTRCGLLLLEPICFRVRCVVCSEMYSADLGCRDGHSSIFIDFRLDSDSRKRTHEYFEKQLKSFFNLNIYITDIQKADRSRTPASIRTANIFQCYIL